MSTVITFLSASAIVRIIRAGHAVVGMILCFYISAILNVDCTKSFAYWCESAATRNSQCRKHKFLPVGRKAEEVSERPTVLPYLLCLFLLSALCIPSSF